MGQFVFNFFKMKILLLLTFVVYSLQSNIIEVTSASDRTFCCGNIQRLCASACSGQDCTRQCQGTCGIFSTRCGPYTCKSVTTACVTPAPADSSSSSSSSADSSDSSSSASDSSSSSSSSSSTASDSSSSSSSPSDSSSSSSSPSSSSSSSSSLSSSSSSSS